MKELKSLYENIIKGHSDKINIDTIDLTQIVDEEVLPFTLLHYAFIYRQFECVEKLMEKLTDNEKINILTQKGPVEYEWITPIVCASWNLNFIRSYSEKKQSNIYKDLAKFFENDNYTPLKEYDEIVLGNNAEKKSVFDIFFNGYQPMLDVTYYEKQTLASKQVAKNKMSLVMDEVGTGKTVSALYAIRDTIQEAINNKVQAKILIVCPYNKREEWQNDVRRQIGRYSHIVEQMDDGNIYNGELKNSFFYDNEHRIFITGQSQSQKDKIGSNTALKGTLERWKSEKQTIYSDNLLEYKWDLVIIDEGHMSFKNYFNIKSEGVMILTATPIVVNSQGIRDYSFYCKLLNEITENSSRHRIDPINIKNPTEDDIFVNWFREDYRINASERNIRFEYCERHEKRQEMFRIIEEEVDQKGKVKGYLAALQYDQDDTYLFEKAKEYNIEIGNLKINSKLNQLVKIIKYIKSDDPSKGLNNKSYIIFCEHDKVVDIIYSELRNNFTEVIIGKKCGKNEEAEGIEGIQNGQLINDLKQALRHNRRVIFITTGKSGATGLNLGEFDGVIHYELPFTSIELEQRFGRVDRMDTINTSNEKEMIFLLNKCEKNQNDLIVNRMLYYCTTKIDTTCRYMPVRNTVLYHPRFIIRNQLVILEALEIFKNNEVLNKKNEEELKQIKDNIKEKAKEITENAIWVKIFDDKRQVDNRIKRLLSSEKRDDIDDEFYKQMEEYDDYITINSKKTNAFDTEFKKFIEFEKIAKQWLMIIGEIVVEDENIFVSLNEKEDSINDMEKLEILSDYNIENEYNIEQERNEENISNRIEFLICEVSKVNTLRFGAKFTNGIFYYNNKKIERSEVGDFRGI